MRNKKIVLFVVLMVLITGLSAVDSYAAKSMYAAPVSTIVDVTVNNTEEFHGALLAAMKEVKDAVNIKISKYDKDAYDIGSAVNKILNDNPELFYAKYCTSTWTQDKGGNSGIMAVNIYYLYSKDKIKLMTDELNSKVYSIISKKIQLDMNNNTKELMVHDYLVMNTKYIYDDLTLDSNMTDEPSTSYSVLVKGQGDSKGYARTMKLLLGKAGIECMVVDGTGHSWNIVKIETDYYHLDSSADKLQNAQGKEVLTHDYFNITDMEMSRYNDWDRSKYPGCTSNKCNYFYKNNTMVSTVDEFEAKVREAIEEVRDSISIRVTSFDETVYDVTNALRSVMKENPMLDDVYEWYWAENESLGTINIIFNYYYTKEEILSKRQEIEKKADEIVKSVIKPGMGDYSKVLVIHDYIIENSSIDRENIEKDSIPPDEYYAYGVLVKGKSVYSSYADAMKLLLDKAGVECIIVEGDIRNSSEDSKNDKNYIWNIVKIEGKYYHVDAAGDDEKVDDGERVVYWYFNIDDKEMRKTHIWDQEEYPSCTSTEQNYFYRNKLVASSNNSAITMIKNALQKRHTRLLMKITDYDNTKYNVEDMITKAFHKTNLSLLKGARWGIYEKLGIIDIEFEY